MSATSMKYNTRNNLIIIGIPRSTGNSGLGIQPRTKIIDLKRITRDFVMKGFMSTDDSLADAFTLR